MTLEIESSRFGRVEIDPDTVIEFPEGLIGLGGSRYALIARDPDTPFVWLQSLEDPELALPVTNPHQFFADFTVEMDEDEAQRLGFDSAGGVDVYVTVRASNVLEEFTANLKAPILVQDGIAHQVINQAEGAQLRTRLFADLPVEQGESASDGAC
jgi:flagellar assembly factor FliW